MSSSVIRCLTTHFLSSEFNHVRNEAGECVLVAGTTPLPDDDSCRNDEEFWYERTEYRKIPFSTCEDGIRSDRGIRHRCPGLRGRGFFFWMMVVLLPFGFTALVGYWYYRRSGMARGCVSFLAKVSSFQRFG
jgi:hypothetical protein